MDEAVEAGHHLVVVGAGFGGLQLVRDLKGAGLRITLIDQRNHHLFQPLLYRDLCAGCSGRVGYFVILSIYSMDWDVRHGAAADWPGSVAA